MSQLTSRAWQRAAIVCVLASSVVAIDGTPAQAQTGIYGVGASLPAASRVCPLGTGA